MQGVAASDKADAVVQRCTVLAKGAASGGMGWGWLGVRGLQVTESDLGRGSGTVTVEGTLLTQGPSHGMTFTWPVTREDDRWTVSDVPEVDVQ